MGQITIDLDDDIERRLQSMAEAAGIPVSRFVADLLGSRIPNDWPESVQNFPGTWDQSVQRPPDGTT